MLGQVVCFWQQGYQYTDVHAYLLLVLINKISFADKNTRPAPVESKFRARYQYIVKAWLRVLIQISTTKMWKHWLWLCNNNNVASSLGEDRREFDIRNITPWVTQTHIAGRARKYQLLNFVLLSFFLHSLLPISINYVMSIKLLIVKKHARNLKWFIFN